MSMTSKVLAVAGRIRRVGWSGAMRDLTRRGVERLGEARAWDEPSLPLRSEDVRAGAALPPIPGRDRGRLRIGWVCFPPSAGSGGHTTLFRMVQAMADRGHDCTLVLYDRNGDDVSRHEPVIRRAWPGLTARVASAADGFGGYDAVVASSWPTAQVVAARNTTAVPFYFIQDYEPFFYPRGYLYGLAESTYSAGLQNIALGGMVATELARQVGVVPDLVVPFGCDTETYRLLPAPAGQSAPRRGVVYYAKRTVDRRGYLLAKAALERFHELCPDQPVHVVGDTVHGWTIPVVQHGSVPPDQLNVLYNRTIAGLAMSFTNVSLVPGELLASGNVPVLNDAAGPRLDLDSLHAVWAPGTPDGLAAALADVVGVSDVAAAERAQRIAAAPRPSWAATQAMTADFIEARVRRGTVSRDRRAGSASYTSPWTSPPTTSNAPHLISHIAAEDEHP
ncbi:glycosyltransferase family 1 protein [Microbacterium sp. A93]|uniref:glycosyltransferase family 1 protein n=1 Tax=Microbacterium sp. A93 TaxID=3450716 RepID=UPI003F444CFE